MSGKLAFYNMLACLYLSMCVCLPAYLLHVCLPVFLSRYLSVCLVACLYYLPTCRFPFSQSSCHVYLFYRVFYLSVCWSFLSLILPALLFVYPVSLFCLPVRPSYSVYLPTCAAPLCRPTSMFPLYFDHSSASPFTTCTPSNLTTRDLSGFSSFPHGAGLPSKVVCHCSFTCSTLVRLGGGRCLRMQAL